MAKRGQTVIRSCAAALTRAQVSKTHRNLTRAEGKINPVSSLAPSRRGKRRRPVVVRGTSIKGDCPLAVVFVNRKRLKGGETRQIATSVIIIFV